MCIKSNRDLKSPKRKGEIESLENKLDVKRNLKSKGTFYDMKREEKNGFQIWGKNPKTKLKDQEKTARRKWRKTQINKNF